MDHRRRRDLRKQGTWTRFNKSPQFGIWILYRFIYAEVGQILRHSHAWPLIIYDFGRKSNLAFLRYIFYFSPNLSQWIHLRKWKFFRFSSARGRICWLAGWLAGRLVCHHLLWPASASALAYMCDVPQLLETYLRCPYFEQNKLMVNVSSEPRPSVAWPSSLGN